MGTFGLRASDEVARAAGSTGRGPRARTQRRAANEAIARAGSGEPFLCECADRRCGARIALEPHEYLAVREVPGQLLVATGHEQDASDMVVEIHDGYRVVERPPSELFLG